MASPPQPPSNTGSDVGTTTTTTTTTVVNTDVDLPLLAFVMMVRDEGENIARVLRRVLPHVQVCFITDTGSVDNTMDEVRTVFAEFPNVKCELDTHEWHGNFVEVRMHLLHRVHRRARWVLTIDGGNDLHGGDALVRWLESKSPTPTDAMDDVFHLAIVQRNPPDVSPDQFTMHLSRVFRGDVLDRGWVYEGVGSGVHELLHNTRRPEANALNKRRVPSDVYVFHDRCQDHRKSEARWHIDLAGLKKAMDTIPTSKTEKYTRNLLMLARTHKWLQQMDSAAECYERLLNLPYLITTERASAAAELANCRETMFNTRMKHTLHAEGHALAAVVAFDANNDIDKAIGFALTVASRSRAAHVWLSRHMAPLSEVYTLYLRAYEMSPTTQRASLLYASYIAESLGMPRVALDHVRTLCRVSGGDSPVPWNQRHRADSLCWVRRVELLCKTRNGGGGGGGDDDSVSRLHEVESAHARISREIPADVINSSMRASVDKLVDEFRTQTIAKSIATRCQQT